MSLLNPARPLRIGVGHRKGGTTKTTVATYLALSIARRFPHVMVHLIDADQTNDSASAWARVAGHMWPDNLIVHRWEWEEHHERLADFAGRVVPDDAHMVVDTGPHAQNALADGMRLADIFLVPLRPSPMEVASLFPTLQLAAAVYDESPFELRALLSDAGERTRVFQEAEEALRSGFPIGDEGELVPVDRVETVVPHSVRYVEAFGMVPRNLGVFPDLLQELIEMGETK